MGEAQMLIRSIEAYNRGFFAKRGYVDGAGDGEFSVALRTGVFDGEVGWVYAGCGIVEGSVADDGYDEIGMKLKTVYRRSTGKRLRTGCAMRRSCGERPVPGRVLRRAGTMGRARRGGQPRVALDAAGHDGLRAVAPLPDRLRLFVDVDERGAAYLALGLAKASGQPAAVICTSGTAVANYYPAVLEAESSRVPLIVLTGDRPARLQGLGAPQTCDQLNAYGSHVRAFRNMPEPAADAAAIALARQAAREACIAA
ncbi:MAG: thiamine pyrophosphate-binding protein, partial [Eggerthella lenta]